MNSNISQPRKSHQSRQRSPKTVLLHPKFITAQAEQSSFFDGWYTVNRNGVTTCMGMEKSKALKTSDGNIHWLYKNPNTIYFDPDAIEKKIMNSHIGKIENKIKRIRSSNLDQQKKVNSVMSMKQKHNAALRFMRRDPYAI